ncbi:unnamed protein product, partial [Prorocentrum cordatum]
QLAPARAPEAGPRPARPAPPRAAEPGATCRICLQGDVPQDELLAPCACQGSAKWVHAGCLREWQRTVLRGPISAFDRVTTCDICRQRFRCGVPPALQLRLAGSFLGRALVNLPLLLAIPFCWTVATGSYAWLSGQLQPGVVGLGVGSLLVATDRIRTGIFARSVVLLVEHSAWGAKDWAHHHQPPHERQRPHCPLPRGPRAQEHLRRSPLQPATCGRTTLARCRCWTACGGGRPAVVARTPRGSSRGRAAGPCCGCEASRAGRRGSSRARSGGGRGAWSTARRSSSSATPPACGRGWRALPATEMRPHWGPGWTMQRMRGRQLAPSPLRGAPRMLRRPRTSWIAWRTPSLGRTRSGI